MKRQIKRDDIFAMKRLGVKGRQRMRESKEEAGEVEGAREDEK